MSKRPISNYIKVLSGLIILCLTNSLSFYFGYSYKGPVEPRSIEVRHSSAPHISIVSVHDGDTFNADISGWPDVVGHDIPIRIAGIDTPEVRDHDPAIKHFAMEVRDAVKLKLTRASKIELRNIRRDKYFRLLCDVYADDINIAAWLLASKFAKPYDGGTKTTWTEKDIP